MLVETGTWTALMKKYWPAESEDLQSFEESLQKEGMTVDDVDIIIQTHLHHDHTGNTSKCKNAEVYVQEEEWAKDKERELIFLINHHQFDVTIIYKDRWQIELFFTALKQNVKVTTFVGTTENALYIQIWTALIAMLLIKYLQFKSRFGWSLSNLVAFLRWNLFTYRDLWEWIDSPFDVLPLVPKSVQLPLPLAGLGQHVQIRTT